MATTTPAPAPQDPPVHEHRLAVTGDDDYACTVPECYVTWDPESDSPRPLPSVFVSRFAR